jgi:hypothetical protein
MLQNHALKTSDDGVLHLPPLGPRKSDMTWCDVSETFGSLRDLV